MNNRGQKTQKKWSIEGKFDLFANLLSLSLRLITPLPLYRILTGAEQDYMHLRRGIVHET